MLFSLSFCFQSLGHWRWRRRVSATALSRRRSADYRVVRIPGREAVRDGRKTGLQNLDSCKVWPRAVPRRRPTAGLETFYRGNGCKAIAHTLLIERAGADICGVIFHRCELRAPPAPPLVAVVHQCLDSGVGRLNHPLVQRGRPGLPIGGRLSVVAGGPQAKIRRV